MAENPASSMIEGAFSLGALAYQDELNQNAAKQQQKWTIENQQRAMEQQTALMRVATPLAVQGMRDAGINPQSMKQAASSPSTPSAPQGARVEPANVAESLAVGQMVANTRLTNAEAEGKEIENARENETDSIIKDAYLKKLAERIDYYNSKGMDTSGLEEDYARAQASETFNLGTIAANLSAIEAESRTLDQFTKVIENTLKNIGLDKLIDTHNTIEADLLESKYALQMAQASYYSSASAESQARIGEIDHRLNEIDEHVVQMQKEGKLTEAQANKIINSDVNTLLENGEVKKAVRAELVNGLDSFSHGAGQTFGLAAGLRMRGLSSAGAGLSRLSSLSGSSARELLTKRIGKGAADGIYKDFVASPYRKMKGLNDFESWLRFMQKHNWTPSKHGIYPPK